MAAMPSVSFEPTVSYRKRAASMGSSTPYSVAMALVEVMRFDSHPSPLLMQRFSR